MSRRSEAKKARRNKRRAAKNATWLPDEALEGLDERLDEVVAGLEEFDARLTERGWIFDVDFDDDVGVIWYWPPSAAEVEDPDEVTAATMVALIEAEGGEIAHVVLVGTDVDYQFGLDELFDYLDPIEGYRLGDPLPQFDTG
ncbi:hypothetical protein CQY20_28645 [Mycolicibacterium agri]|uniref:Uncharacterized protein n=1 Tax=Mycolicibacterium agri TaxID=36811 RepID=A0A2A7MRA8_MYCAG|nr:hypothetical protein [Mycolicibacterium agri]PEG33851.1 hypothetical protein CQY20_28645 [Mycolicibacterium agri]GFG52828.1 hypothetical protein MAGR_42690 [Mycolicibacterium agri]